MGLRDGRRGGPSRKFQMREKMFAVGDDYWIEDEQGQRVFRVNGKALRMRQTFVLEDASGTELATIREKKLAIRDTMKIEIGEQEAKMHKRALGIRDRFIVELEDDDDYSAKGNFVDHEYEIERDGSKVAEVSKKWFRLRDTYGVEVFGEQDLPMILAITVCIDSLSHDRVG
ncbi:MAG: LURP-one-related/scramblase family protein [Actinomycetes bacterium]